MGSKKKVSRPLNGKIPGKKAKASQLELRVRMLLRNGLVSKSTMTLASTEVLEEIAERLGYDTDKLRTLDITDDSVNPYCKR